MVLTGAYAVLRGAPALVVAVSRGAVATGGTVGVASREVRAALGTDDAPLVDTSALYDGARKLGLGASAAALVATLGLRAHERGDDLSSPAVRAALFTSARRAHAEAQAGGSGIDVAASVHGGALVYRLEGAAASVAPCPLPPGVVFRAYASPVAARTTDLREKVAAFSARDSVQDARIFGALGEASAAAHAACVAGDATRFLSAAREFGLALHALGAASGAPIVSTADVALASLAAASGAAYFPSGAGGGDVAVALLPASAPADLLDAAARAHGKAPLDLTLDSEGVRVVTSSSRLVSPASPLARSAAP